MNRIGTIAVGFLSLTPFVSASGIVHPFGTAAWDPYGGLVRDAAGNLYGTTAYGSKQAGTFYGTVFKLAYTAPGEYTYSTLYAFKGYPTDGNFPVTALTIDASGNLYGTTITGGSQDYGTVFELSPSSGEWTYKLLYSFPAVQGCGAYQGQPLGRLLVDSSGNVYGTTVWGGSYCKGTVFKLSPGAGGWSEQDIYTFTGKSDGGQPNGGLIADSTGNLYGNAAAGGLGNGVVYELSPSAGSWSQTVLYKFEEAAYGHPVGELASDALGNLYGVGAGDVFELSPSAGVWTEKLIHIFPQSQMDFYPGSGVVFDSDGNLYGTSFRGGAQNMGFVYKLTPSGGGNWSASDVHSFSGPDGAFPESAVTVDAIGNIYGTTVSGGPSSLGGYEGVVYEISVH